MCVLTIYTRFSKNLTWRDMQHLVVRTSHPAHLLANDWKTNGVGRKGTWSPFSFFFSAADGRFEDETCGTAVQVCRLVTGQCSH